MGLLSTILLLILGGSINALAVVQINFQQENWKDLGYVKGAENKFQYGEKLVINVKKSASPIIFKFEEVQDVATIEFEFSIQGDMNSSKDAGFEEDSFLQIGLVALGDNQLGAMGKIFAPKWVSQLFQLPPEGSGLDKVYFFNVANAKNSVNQERQNPKSKYMYERFIFSKDDAGKPLTYTLPKKLKSAALWVSAEGETTESEFTTTVAKIVLK